MLRRCRISSEEFEVTQQDLDFLERISPRIDGTVFPIPAPTLAPKLRTLRRLVWRNAHSLYRRKCDLSGQSIISAYPADSEFKVYAINSWWGDAWDGCDYGQEYDFSRSFFEQFRELQLKVPRLALLNKDSENSEYCNYAGHNRNCYLASLGSWYNDGALYGEGYLRCRDCADSSFLHDSELCLEVVGGRNLYECVYLNDCYDCSSCFFSRDLRSCQDCFFCCNLRNKRNYVLNQPATAAQVAELRRQMRSYSGWKQLYQQFKNLQAESWHPAVHLLNCEQSSGDYLTRCKNVSHSYNVQEVEDGRYLLDCAEAKDLQDCSHTGYGMCELYYETVNAGGSGNRSLFSQVSWFSSDVMYCDTVMSCQNCFGCVGLKNQQYCILNKKYSREDYQRTVRKIIKHMMQTEEWGEFFPFSMTPFAYNESTADGYWHLSQNQVEKLGGKWRGTTEQPESTKSGKLPDNLDNTSNEVLSETFCCADTGQSYRIVKPELILYQKLGVALPLYAPAARRALRALRRGSPTMRTCRCATCGTAVYSGINAALENRILCEECYLKALD